MVQIKSGNDVTITIDRYCIDSALAWLEVVYGKKAVNTILSNADSIKIIPNNKNNGK